MTPLAAIFLIVGPALLSGMLAKRKGYCFFLWMPIGMTIALTALVIMAFLPRVYQPESPPTERQVRFKKIGNIIGGVITAMAAIELLNVLINGKGSLY
jgi:hypothetical protein